LNMMCGNLLLVFITGFFTSGVFSEPCTAPGDLCVKVENGPRITVCDACPSGSTCKLWQATENSYCQLDACIAVGGSCGNRVGLCCTGSSCTYNAETATVACTADPTTTTTTTTTTPTTTTTVSIVIEAATNTITSQSCLTTSGSKCAFPFIFDGKIFTDCTTTGGYAPWCSTKTDANGYHVPGNYGDCVSSTCTATTPSITTTAPATNAAPSCVSTSGSACVFPFTYGGKVYTWCTLDGGFSIPWCSTKTDESGNHIQGNFGDCPGSCYVQLVNEL